MPRILVVEDNAVLSRIYQQTLRAAGYSVDVATTGEEALRRLDTAPDLVLLDLMLPQVNGVEVLKAIRARPELARTRVIVFSNAYAADRLEALWAAGPDRVITKADHGPKQMLEIIREELRTGATPAPEATAELTPAPVSGVTSMLREQVPQMRRALAASGDPSQSTSRRDLAALAGEVAAALPGQSPAARLAAALYALALELADRPESATVSTQRTFNHALARLLVESPATPPLAPPAVLVVDDDEGARTDANRALERAGLAVVAVSNAAAALRLLTDNTFALVVLDAQLPGENGFEVCARLRALPAHVMTPVVFLVDPSHFGNVVQFGLTAGADVLGRPLSERELAVKAWATIVR